MRNKIFKSIFLTAFISSLFTVCLIFGVMYMQFYTEMKSEVQKETDLVLNGILLSGDSYLENLDGDHYRITLISPDGTVLYDSLANPESMENHADRPEIQSALEYGVGESTRMSATIGEQLFYRAVLMPDGVVLRVASFTSSIYASLVGCIPFVVIAILVTLILSAMLARRRTKTIIEPINNINLDEPLQNDLYEEMSPLLTRIEKQHRQISLHMLELQRMRDEFTAITNNMNEGLILLGKNGVVLSINNSAREFFNTDIKCIGRNILTIDRSLKLQEIILEATEGRRAETTVSIKDNSFSSFLQAL